jgi:hypothetical protein
MEVKCVYFLLFYYALTISQVVVFFLNILKHSGVVMWKSQSPWPSLRGQLYDSSLEQSGGFWGIQRATSNNLRESDLVALAAYFVSKYNTSRSAAANGDDAAAEGAEGGAAAAKGGAYERRTVESERRGGFYCSRSQNRGPPLHVQINPMNLVCAVINRGRHVYPSPHTPFPANSTSGRSDISNLAKETTYVFTVRADFRTLYGIQVSDLFETCSEGLGKLRR